MHNLQYISQSHMWIKHPLASTIEGRPQCNATSDDRPFFDIASQEKVVLFHVLSIGNHFMGIHLIIFEIKSA